jgi:hypothetical protein
MNRVKVWVYALAVAAVAYVTLRAHTEQLRTAAMREVDARLAATSTQVFAAARAISREASAAAAIVARDPKVLAALHPPEVAPAPAPVKGKRTLPPPPPPEPSSPDALAAAARAALVAAEKALGFELPDGTSVVAATRESIARKGGGIDPESEAGALLRGALAGKPQRGYVRHAGAVWFATSAPAGDGAGVVVLAPVGEAWVRSMGGATGALVTLTAPETKALSNAGAQAQAFSTWTHGAGIALDVGQLGKMPFELGALKLPPMPSPFASAPSFRARAVPLDGLKGGFVVLAFPLATSLGGIAQLHWQIVVGIAVALLAGLLLGLFVRSAEAPPAVPAELLAAADRIERGDFAARAPPLAGTFGTVAAALNRAAELAGPAAAAETARASSASSVSEEFFAKPAAAPSQPAPEPAAAPAPPAAEPAPAAAPEPFQAAVPAALLDAAVRTAPPPAAAQPDEEGHFRQVFQDFLRTRATCGEASEGLTYEKFRLKLDGNKAALVAKYACKTVRFQVYVKEGKAALKATPVK